MKSNGLVLIVSLLVLFSGITFQKNFTSKVRLTPWMAVGGCGPCLRDSLIGTWKWFRTCGDSAWTCNSPEFWGFSKYLKFTFDSAYSYKNDSLIAAIAVSAEIPTSLGFPGIGLNNGRTPVSYLILTIEDTAVFSDSCFLNDDCYYYQYYMRVGTKIKNSPGSGRGNGLALQKYRNGRAVKRIFVEGLFSQNTVIGPCGSLYSTTGRYVGNISDGKRTRSPGVFLVVPER